MRPRSSTFMTLTQVMSPDLEHVLDLLGALELKILDLDETVLARSQLDPCAELAADVGDFAVVQLADLRLEDDVLDGLARGAAGLDVLGGDEDGAVVLDVDLAAGVGAIFWMTLPPEPMTSRSCRG